MTDHPDPILDPTPEPTPEPPAVAEERKARETIGAGAFDHAPAHKPILRREPPAGQSEPTPSTAEPPTIWVRKGSLAYYGPNPPPEDRIRFYRPLYIGGMTPDEWKATYGVDGEAAGGDLGDPELVAPPE